MDPRTRLTTEHGLYLLALILAAALRLSALDGIPLAENEARWALQAHQLAHGELAAVGSQPLYVLLTGFLFRLLGSGEALARLLPALAGSALVLLPLAWRDVLGRLPALALAFGLALDPGLVALSRLAGGPILALSLLLFALTLWRQGHAARAGALLALALLSGPAVWAGLLVLVFSGLLFALLRRQPLRLPGGDLRRAALFGGGVLLLAGTFFLRLPGGLGGFAASFPAYWATWGAHAGVPPGRLLFALVAYQPLATLFALIALVRFFQRPDDSGFFWLASLLAAMLVAGLNPGRQVADLAWVLIPLWGLAAGALVALLRPAATEDPRVAGAEALLLLVFFSYIWFSLAGLGRVLLEDPQTLQLRLALSGIVLALAAVSTVLVGIGWSYAEAGRGALWGVSAFLLFFMLSALVSASFRRETAAAELWWNGPAPGHADLMAATLGDLSEFHLGERTSLDVGLQTDQAAVAWALRGMPNVLYSPLLSPGEHRSALVTDHSAVDLLTAAGYRGQSFVVAWQPAWDGALPPNLLGWLLFRQAPATPDMVILWGRAALFPGAAP